MADRCLLFKVSDIISRGSCRSQVMIPEWDSLGFQGGIEDFAHLVG
jgi:hypothetical protein